MAIIDRNAVFFEGSLTANATGNTVALTACKLPGRMEPMPLRLFVTKAQLDFQGCIKIQKIENFADNKGFFVHRGLF